jgi:hypothetical protein
VAEWFKAAVLKTPARHSALCRSALFSPVFRAKPTREMTAPCLPIIPRAIEFGSKSGSNRPRQIDTDSGMSRNEVAQRGAVVGTPPFYLSKPPASSHRSPPEACDLIAADACLLRVGAAGSRGVDGHDRVRCRLARRRHLLDLVQVGVQPRGRKSGPRAVLRRSRQPLQFSERVVSVFRRGIRTP